MESKRDIEKKARELIDSNPEEAVRLYHQIWNEYTDLFNAWDAFFTSKALRKTSNPDMDWAQEMAEQFDDDKVRGQYSWLFYDQLIKDKSKDEITRIENKIKTLIDIVPQKDQRQDSTYPCPLTIIIFKVVDIHTENLFLAAKVNDWLSYLDPELLSITARKINTEQRGEIEVASDLERYYSLKTKALLKLERFEECKDLCQKGLDEVSTFHYNNDLWFKMRIAISEERIGNVYESEKLFKSILRTKAGSDKWFLYRDISELYYDQKNYTKAWKYAVDASFYGNELHFMIGLYLLQARILFRLEKPHEGKILGELIMAILNEQGWKNKSEYDRLFKYYSLNPHELEKTNYYFRKARQFWANERYRNYPVLEGTIISIHKNGKVGRIKISENNIVGFHRKDFVEKLGNLNELVGAKVEFVVMESYDGKEIAENIKIIEKQKRTKSHAIVGQILEGVVKSIVDFGLFVKFDGLEDGLLHKNNLPDNLKSNFNQRFNPGDKIKVIVSNVTEKGLQLKLADE